MNIVGGKSEKVTKNTKFDFFSSGSYGCTMHPNISCRGNVNPSNTKNILSKLTIDDVYSNNEYKIGQILKNLKSENKIENEIFLNHMIYVTKKCDIKKNKSEINKRKYKCNIINETKKKSENHYVLMYMKYLDSNEFSKVLKNTYNKANVAKLLLKYYFFTIKMISFLCQHKIVHHDLHLSNLLVEKETNNLYMIDFGHAIHVDPILNQDVDLNDDQVSSLFHAFDPSWPYWPIEYHVLSFYIFKGKQLNMKDIIYIVDHYYDNVRLFKHIYSGKKLLQYKAHVVNFIKMKFMNKIPIKEKALRIIHDSWKTWDLYQTNYLMLSSLLHYKIDFSESLIQICKIGLHYDASMRYDSEFYMNRIIELLKSFTSQDQYTKKNAYETMESEEQNEKEVKMSNTFFEESIMTYPKTV